MKKKYLFLSLIFLATTSLFAYEGGSLSCEPGATVINPVAPVTITYDGTGTNFANWAPKCHAHMWLSAAEGQEFSKEGGYKTGWIDYAGKGGDDAWALVPDNQKMEKVGSGNTGIYKISLSSVYEYFGVEEADKSKVAQLGMVVRAQYEGANNQTENIYIAVQESTEPYISLTIPTSVFLDEEISFNAATSNIENLEINYLVKLPGASEFVAVSSSYQPTMPGTHTFRAEANVSGYPAIVAFIEKEVLVKAIPDEIVIRAKVPAEWTNPHIFCWNTNSDGFKAMTLVGAWYQYTFTRDESVSFLFVEGDTWSNDNNQSVDIENLTESSCYIVGNETTGKRLVTAINCDELSTPITIRVKAPADWNNVHFYYWSNVPEIGGFVQPVTKGTENVYYEYTFTRFDELNFLVVNGDDWAAEPKPEQTVNVENVLTDSCYEVGEVDEETSNRYISAVGCDGFSSLLKIDTQEVIIKIDNHIMQVITEKASNIELYNMTGQLIRSTQNVNLFTQNVNSGIYLLRINGEAHKIMIIK